MRLDHVVPALVLIAVAAPAGVRADERVDWLRDHAIPMRTVDPADHDFADLEPLRAELAGVRVVQLGEQSHGDGTTFLAKTRIIEFLHQELGFDVLAFESGLYDCRRAWRELRDGGDPQEAIELGVFPIWTRSAQLTPLVLYLGAAARSERPLELCGFDCQFTGRASRELLLSDFETLRAEHAPGPEDASAWADTAAMIANLVNRAPRPDATQRRTWLRAAAAVGAALGDADGPASEAGWWRQVLESTVAYAAVAWVAESGQDTASLAQRFNPRDAQMSDNLLWLLRERYPDRRVIVWAATMHIQRNPHVIDTMLPALDYTGMQPMGHLISEALGADVYTIGFTAGEGRAGLPWSAPWDLAPASTGSLESLAIAAGLENAIIPLRSAPVDSWLRTPIVSRPLGHQPMRADWTQVLDAMVFTRFMLPSTDRNRIPAVAADADPDFGTLVAEQWARISARLAAGQGYADKTTFVPVYTRWKEACFAGSVESRDALAAFERWSDEQPATPDLRWRGAALRAAVLVDLARVDEARAQLDAALAAYPDRTYAAASKQSSFQHLVNTKAMLVWDTDGLAAAVEMAGQLLARDERYHYFHAWPWTDRLERSGKMSDWSAIRARISAAYAARADAFPAQANAARQHAAELP